MAVSHGTSARRGGWLLWAILCHATLAAQAQGERPDQAAVADREPLPYHQALSRSLWPEETYVGLGLALEDRPGCPGALEIPRRGQSLLPAGRDLQGPGAQARCREEDNWQIAPQAYLDGQYYRGSPYKTFSEGVGLAVAVNYRRSYYAALSYHFVATEGKDTYPGYAQHEIYGVASYSLPRLAAALSYAYVYESSTVIGASNHVGLSGRFSPLGDIFLNTAVSVYSVPSVSAVLRGEVSWRIPLGRVLSVQPGVAAYWTNVAGYGDGLLAGHVSGLLTLHLSTARGSIWAGGKIGDEYRSAYMDLPAFYDQTEHVSGGAWLGGRLRVDRRWSLSAHAAWDRYYQPVDQTQSDGIYLTLGASRVF